MPQRSNQFQRLAAVIHSKLTKGWTVNESQMLRDMQTGDRREVDVVACATVMGHELYLCAECRDHARPADVTWIEAMAKKHESLPTSKLVLWSRSGFTKPAIRKAELLKIDVVSSKDANNVDWARIARNLVGGSVQLVSPTFSPFLDVRKPDGTLERLEGPKNFQWFKSTNGELAGAMHNLIQWLATDGSVRALMLDHAPEGSGDFWTHICPPDGEEWFTRDEQGICSVVTRIGIGIRTSRESLPLEVASATHQGKVKTLATATTVVGDRFDFYVEECADGQVSTDARQISRGK